MNKARETTGGLQDRAMVIRIHLARLPSGKVDKEATKFAQQEFKSKQNSGKYVKVIFTDEDRLPFTKLESKIRAYYYAVTLPWTDKFERIMATRSYFDITQRIGQLQDEYWKLAEDFLSRLPEKKKNAEKALGRMFHDKEFPTEDEVRGMFAFDVDIHPIPNSSDIRVVSNLTDSEKEEIERLCAMRMQEQTRKAMKDIGLRIAEVLKDIIEKIKSGKSFHDTIITNVKDLSDIIPSIDITESDKLRGIKDRLDSEICSIDPKALRKDDKLKKDAVKSADQILKSVEGFFEEVK